jgi:hypothetical protein
MVQLVRQLMAERAIDQEIDFKIQRVQRHDLLSGDRERDGETKQDRSPNIVRTE